MGSAHITSQLIVQENTTFVTAASPACSCSSQNQTGSPCGPCQVCAPFDVLLVLLICSWVAIAILLVLTIGMAMYICKARRSQRLSLTAVKMVGVQLPAFGQRTGGGREDAARRQPNGVKKPISAEEVAPPPAAATHRVDLHCGGYADGVTFHNEKQPTGTEQLRCRGRAPTAGTDGLTLPAEATSAARGASASPAPSRRAADSQLGAAASPASLRPSALCPAVHTVSGATAGAASPVRGLAPPPSPLPVPASPATSRVAVRGPPSPLPVPINPATASLPQPRLRTAATLERTLQPCAAISARGAGNCDGGNLGAGPKRSANSSSSRSSTSSSTSSVGDSSACLVRSYNDAIVAKALEPGGGLSNVTCATTSSSTAEKASAAASTAYAKAAAVPAAPVVGRKSSRFRAAAEVRRLSDSQLNDCRRDFRRSDVDGNLYIAVLPSPPQQQPSSESCHDGDDYENAGPVTTELFERKQPPPRRPVYENGRAFAAGEGQRRAPSASMRRQRRRSLESCIDDYDYCFDETWQIHRLRRLT